MQQYVLLIKESGYQNVLKSFLQFVVDAWTSIFLREHCLGSCSHLFASGVRFFYKSKSSLVTVMMVLAMMVMLEKMVMVGVMIVPMMAKKNPQISWFTAWLALDESRIQSGRNRF